MNQNKTIYIYISTHSSSLKLYYSCSSSYPMKYGVLQGSVLSPSLLYLFISNNIYNI